MFYLRSSRESENEAVRSRYKSFVQQRGELFEDKEEALTQEDILDIEKRKRIIDRKCWIAFAASTSLSIFFLWIDPTPNFIREFGFVAFWVFIALGLRFIILRNINRALKSNKKRVVQGVISSKISIKGDRKDSGYYFEMTYREKIKIRPGEYKKNKVGDILRIEILSDDIYIRKKFVTLGKI